MVTARRISSHVAAEMSEMRRKVEKLQNRVTVLAGRDYSTETLEVRHDIDSSLL